MDIEERIREEYRAGASYRQLAKKYRLSFRKLAEIIKGGEADAYLPTWKVAKLFEEDKTELHLYYNYNFYDFKISEAFEELAQAENVKSEWFRLLIFRLVKYLAEKGYEPVREDLDAVLKGSLSFHAMRWVKRSVAKPG
jgi:uncharacterized protein (DUF433 family)